MLFVLFLGFILFYPSHTRLTAYPSNRKRFRISANTIYTQYTPIIASTGNGNYARQNNIIEYIMYYVYNIYIVYSVVIYNITLCLNSSFLFDFYLSSSSLSVFFLVFRFGTSISTAIISSLRLYWVYTDRGQCLDEDTSNIHTYNKDRLKFTKLFYFHVYYNNSKYLIIIKNNNNASSLVVSHSSSRHFTVLYCVIHEYNIILSVHVY